MYFYFLKQRIPRETPKNCFNFACKTTEEKKPKTNEILMGPNSVKRHLKQATTAKL